MNKKIEIQKIKVNNGQELIQKVKEYKNSGGEWKLLERYMDFPIKGEETSIDEYKKLNWGIIVGNGEREVDIRSTKNNINPDGVNDEINVRTELEKLFPEAKNALFNSRATGIMKELEYYTYKRIREKNKNFDLYRYLVAENSWHLTQIVHQWVQENKTSIQQSPNSDFDSWVEIIDGQDGNMYLYVGKKNDDGGREIKIGIKKDKYFEKVEGYNYNSKVKNSFYDAGQELEVNWDLMLITIDFAGWPLNFKGRKNNNNQPVVPQSIKEKILRNLDKICLDPMGEIANAEALKSDEIWDLYKAENLYESGLWEKELATKVYRVEIEGEEIDLTQFVNGHWEDYNEIKNALIREIKQNPAEWKIEKAKTDSRTIVKHKSGRRHWGHAFKYFRENLEKTKRDWAEIEALLKGKSLSADKINDNERNQILQYLIKNDISKISLENGKLVIEYSKGNKKIIKNESQELQKCRQFIQTLPGQSLSLSDLQNNTSNLSTPNKNNPTIYISLAIGVFILGGVFVYFLARKKKK